MGSTCQLCTTHPETADRYWKFVRELMGRKVHVLKNYRFVWRAMCDVGGVWKKEKSIWMQCGVSGWFENHFGRETICEDEVVVVVVGRSAVNVS